MYLDLFFEEEPEREIGNGPDQLYAVAIPSSGDFYHAFVTVEQYKSLIAEDPKLAKSASKIASKVLKSITKMDGSTDECPVHCFSSQIVDLESKKVYRVDKANEDLTDEQIAEILGVEQ